MESYSLTEKTAISLRDASTELNEIYDAIVMYKNEGRKDVVKRFTKIKHLLMKFNESLEKFRFVVIQQRDKRRNNRAATIFSTEASRCILQLDDAISVIRSLAQTTTKREQTQIVTKAEMESTMMDQIKSHFSQNPHFGFVPDNKPSGAGINGRNKKRGRAGAGQNTGAKHDRGGVSTQGYRQQSTYKRQGRNSSVLESGSFADCGLKTHVRGDLRCQKPSHLTILIRKSRADRSSEGTDDHDSQEGKSVVHFLPGSAPAVGN